MRVQKTIGWLLALTPLLALFSCESDDMPDSQQGERVPVTIRLGVEGSGLATRAADDVHHTTALEEEAESAINSLDIFILDGNGNLEKQLDLSTDFNSDASNTATVELTTGSKTVYAIANLPEDIEELELDAIQSNNPLDVIREGHEYIPMSADTTWNVTSSQTTYEVDLIRMVAKMDVTIIDERAASPVTRAEGSHTLTIKEFLPHTTNLFREAHGIIELPEKIDFADFTWENIKYEDSKAHHDHFYLHESKLREKAVFELTLHDGEKERNGSFSAELYRNHYFPLVIHLTDYNMSFEITTNLAAIGTVQVTKTNTSEYTFDLPEGCTFSMKATLNRNMSGSWASDATWDWDVTNSIDEILVFDTGTTWPDNAQIPSGTGETNPTFTFSGTVSAVTTDGKCNIAVTMKDGDAEQTFNIVIGVRALGNGELGNQPSTSALTRSTSPEAQPIIIEL